MKPLHSPYAPKAVVLWTPTVGAPGKVGVVVDPKLGDKLRPHQVEGVQFMFDCITGLNGKNIDGNGCILADGLLSFSLFFFFSVLFFRKFNLTSLFRHGFGKVPPSYYDPLDPSQTRTGWRTCGR